MNSTINPNVVALPDENNIIAIPNKIIAIPNKAIFIPETTFLNLTIN